MNHEQILTVVRQLAQRNGNVPLGERAFFAETHLNRRVLWRAGFPNYGSALEEAGYPRNELKQAYSDDQLFVPLAELIRRLGHFPTEAERTIARHKDSEFPSQGAYRRRAKLEPLPTALLAWCGRSETFQDVAKMLEESIANATRPQPMRSHRKVVSGYVYLMKYGSHGRDFKIGSTDNVGRRESQIDMMSPTDVRVLHSIETDDPKGIEKYWHERFALRRIKTKEVFRLTPEDIAAFKRRRYQ